MKPTIPLVILLILLNTTLITQPPTPRAQDTPCPREIDGQGIVRYVQSLDAIELTLIAGGDRRSITVALAGAQQLPPSLRDNPRLVDMLRDMVELAPVYVDLQGGGEGYYAVLLVPLNLTHLLNVNTWLLEKAGVPVDPGCKVLDLRTLAGGFEGPGEPGGEGGPAGGGRSFMDFAIILLLLFAALVLLVALVSLYG